MVEQSYRLNQFIERSHCFLDNIRDLILIKDTTSMCFGFSQSLCHLLKIKQHVLIGRSDYELPWERFADLYQQCDQEVLKGKKDISLQPLQINKNTIVTAKITKSPIFDEKSEIIGIFGQAEILEVNSAFTQIIVKDRQNSKLLGHTPENYHLSQYTDFKLSTREAECLFFMIRSKSAKEIAQLLEISPRTVECYIENIKNKMNVSKRSEIITKAIDMKLLEIIPKSELLLRLPMDFFCK